MLEVFRFKRLYARLKERRRNTAGEWEVTLQDVRELLDALPDKVVKKFGQPHVRYLKRYGGRVYYENVDALLDSIREASTAIRTNSYLETEALELRMVELSDWVQPTQLACNFGFLLSETKTAFGELVDAYNAGVVDKASYYRRKTVRIVSDVFSLVEVLAELVVAGKELNA